MYPHDPLISKKNRENYVSIWHCTPSPTLSSLELPPLFSLLQLREAKGERPVLPPARSPFPSASGGRWVFGCEGERWLSFGRCRLDTSSSRVWFPAAASRRRRRHRLGITSSRSLPRPVGAPLRRRRRDRGGGAPCVERLHRGLVFVLPRLRWAVDV